MHEYKQLTQHTNKLVRACARIQTFTMHARTFTHMSTHTTQSLHTYMHAGTRTGMYVQTCAHITSQAHNMRACSVHTPHRYRYRARSLGHARVTRI